MKRYWFPVKRYGWGWEPPTTWQGWVTLIVWVAILIPASIWLAPRSLTLFFVFLAVMVAAVIAIGYAKGEPPRWRLVSRQGRCCRTTRVSTTDCTDNAD